MSIDAKSQERVGVLLWNAWLVSLLHIFCMSLQKCVINRPENKKMQHFQILETTYEQKDIYILDNLYLSAI